METISRIAIVEDTPRPVAIAIHIFQGEARTRWHSHRRTEFIYSTNGFLTLTTSKGKWSAPAGYGLLVAPNVLHELAGFGIVDIGAAFFADDDVTPSGAAECEILRVSPLLQATLGALAQEPALYDLSGRAGHLAALAEYEIKRADVIGSGLPLPSHPRLRTLCDDLTAVPDNDWTLDELADMTGFSRSTLTRKFRSETGLSIAEWRRRARLVHFQTLHASGMHPARAAKSAGYDNYRSFREMIRRHDADRAR